MSPSSKITVHSDSPHTHSLAHSLVTPFIYLDLNPVPKFHSIGTQCFSKFCLSLWPFDLKKKTRRDGVLWDDSFYSHFSFSIQIVNFKMRLSKWYICINAVGFALLGVVYLIQNRLHTSFLIQLCDDFMGESVSEMCFSKCEHVCLSCFVMCTWERAIQWIVCAHIWYGCPFVHHIGQVCSLFCRLFFVIFEKSTIDMCTPFIEIVYNFQRGFCRK